MTAVLSKAGAEEDEEEDSLMADSAAVVVSAEEAMDEAENVRDMASCASPSAASKAGGDPKARLKLNFFVGRAE